MNTRIALCGMGGYGETYVDLLLNHAEEYGCVLVAGIDPHPEGCLSHQSFQDRQIPVYPSLETFFAHNRCELTIVSTPIQFHASQTCYALSKGSHVLCEKPLASSLEEVEGMIESEDYSNLSVTVGYQWAFSSAVQQFKQDFLLGRFGRAVHAKAIAYSPRSESYFQRNSWAGCIRDGFGRPVLDSPANNGHAHSLHTLLYLLGPAENLSASCLHVEAELFRANAIENYDTATLRILSEDGLEMLFYTSHAVKDGVKLAFDFEFEKAVATYDLGVEDCLRATLADGTNINYGPLMAPPHEKLRQAVVSAREKTRPVCGTRASLEHTRCIVKAQAAASGIQAFDPQRIQKRSFEKSWIVYFEGLERDLQYCFDKRLLPREAGIALSAHS